MQIWFDYNYSHSKVKFNVNQIDNIIIQRISLFNTNIFCSSASNDILFLNNIFMTFSRDGKKCYWRCPIYTFMWLRNLFMRIWVGVFVFSTILFFLFNVSWSIVHYIVTKWFICYIHEYLDHGCICWMTLCNLVELSKVLYNYCCETSMIYALFVGVTRNGIHGIEMVKIVNDDCIYAKLIIFVKNKKSFITNSLEESCWKSLVMKTRLVKL
jgi:hypothetical protein